MGGPICRPVTPSCDHPHSGGHHLGIFSDGPSNVTVDISSVLDRGSGGTRFTELIRSNFGRIIQPLSFLRLSFNFRIITIIKTRAEFRNVSDAACAMSCLSAVWSDRITFHNDAVRQYQAIPSQRVHRQHPSNYDIAAVTIRSVIVERPCERPVRMQ